MTNPYSPKWGITGILAMLVAFAAHMMASIIGWNHMIPELWWFGLLALVAGALAFLICTALYFWQLHRHTRALERENAELRDQMQARGVLLVQEKPGVLATRPNTLNIIAQERR